MQHYRKTTLLYRKRNAADKQTTICTFCNDNNKSQFVAENGTMFIVPNRVSYDMFEGRRVTDHLMVIPKRHVENLKDLTDKEKLDLAAINGDYESRGYNVYARGVGSITRSVKHQHTHLIKLVNKKPKAIIFSQKPYFLIDF